MTHPHSRAFHTLDGLRGIAALLVVPRHLWQLGAGVSLPESYLAVDLFFLLSGFVIAYAYDQRLSQPGAVLPFLRIRLIRLYPLYIMGIALGALSHLGASLNGWAGWTMTRLTEAILLGVLMIPKTPLTSMGSSELDSPTWTLLPELVANLIYAALFQWLTKSILLAISMAGAFGLIICRFSYGTLDGGWDFGQLPLIAARLSFSFFGGVFLFKLLGDRRQMRPWTAWSCVVVAGLALSLSPNEQIRPFYELGVVLVAFPIIVWIGCQSEPGPMAARIFRFMGLVSYAVYVLHQPAGAFFEIFLKRSLHLNMETTFTANIALAAFFGCLLLGCWLIDRYYDNPLRKWLNRR